MASKKKMGVKTIVFILPNKQGGVSSVVKTLLNNIVNEGIETEVLLLGESKVKSNYNTTKTTIIPLPANKTLLQKCLLIKNHIPKNSIIVSNDGGVELDTIRIFGLQNPVIYILHGNLDYYYTRIKLNSIIINQIISVSNYTCTKVKTFSNELKLIPVQTIHFPVPYIGNNHFNIQNKDLSTRIIFVGQLCQGKGIHFFKELVQKLESSKINYKFSIIGDGILKEDVIQLAKTYTNVMYLGRLTNNVVIETLKNNDILFLPSLSEGLPVSIIEAMKAGLAIVASDLASGIPEIVINNKTGYRVEVGDIEGYANAIIKLAQDRVLLKQLKRNAIELSSKQFDPIIQTNKYLSAIIETRNTAVRKIHVIELLLSIFSDKYRLAINKILK